MPAKNYRELRVYQLAFESSARIQELAKEFPAEEQHSLTDQIRRSSRSACANIAAAWRKRRYPDQFVSKLSDSDAESAETIVWLDFALRFGYLPADAHKELTDHYENICSQLTLIMQEPEKWKPRGAREEPGA